MPVLFGRIEIAEVMITRKGMHSVGEDYRCGQGSEGRGRRRVVTSSSGAVLLLRAAALGGLDQALSAELAPWRTTRARHDPGAVVLDLAALGGDCLADVALLRAQPELFGPVASDPRCRG